jgi:hypothetical protein
MTFLLCVSAGIILHPFRDVSQDIAAVIPGPSLRPRITPREGSDIARDSSPPALLGMTKTDFLRVH